MRRAAAPAGVPNGDPGPPEVVKLAKFGGVGTLGNVGALVTGSPGPDVNLSAVCLLKRNG